MANKNVGFGIQILSTIGMFVGSLLIWTGNPLGIYIFAASFGLQFGYTIVSVLTLPKTRAPKTPAESFSFMGAEAKAEEGMPVGLLLGRNMVGGEILNLKRTFSNFNPDTWWYGGYNFEQLSMLIGLGEGKCEGLPYNISERNARIFVNDQPLTSYIESKPNPVTGVWWTKGDQTIAVPDAFASRLSTTYQQSAILENTGETFVYKVKNQYAQGVNIGIAFLEGLYTRDIDDASIEPAFVTFSITYRDLDTNPDTWFYSDGITQSQREYTTSDILNSTITLNNIVGVTNLTGNKLTESPILKRIKVIASSITTPIKAKIVKNVNWIPERRNHGYAPAHWDYIDTGKEITFSSPDSWINITPNLNLEANTNIGLLITDIGNFEPYQDNKIHFVYECSIRALDKENKITMQWEGSQRIQIELLFPESSIAKNYELKVEEVNKIRDNEAEIEFIKATIVFIEEFELDKLRYPNTALLGLRFNPTQRLSGGTPAIKTIWDGLYVYTLEEGYSPCTKKRYFDSYINPSVSITKKPPILVGSYRDTNNWLFGWGGIDVINNKAYLTGHKYIGTEEGKVTILDVSNPKTPTLLGEWIASYDYRAVHDVKVIDKYAYVCSYTGGVPPNPTGGLTVLDISNPASPAIKFQGVDFGGDLFDNGFHLKISTNGNYLYGVEGNYFWVFDITNKENPIKVGILYDALHLAGVGDFRVDGNYVYINRLNGMTILNISNPATPTYVSELTTSPYGSGYPRDLVKYGNYVYAHTSNTTISVIDVSNVNSPTMISSYTDDSALVRYMDIDTVNKRLYVSNLEDNGGIRVFDISIPTTLTLLYKYNNQNWYMHNSHGIKFVNNFLYVQGGLMLPASLPAIGRFAIFDLNNAYVYGRNPACILYTIYRDILKLSESKLDIDSFRNCKDVAFANDIKFDYAVTATITFSDFIETFKNATGFYPIPEEGKIKLVYDKAMVGGTDVVELTLTEGNIVEGSLKFALKPQTKLPNVAEIKFRDSSNNYEETTFLVVREDVLGYEVYELLEILLLGVTEKEQAKIRGNIILNTPRLEDGILQVKVSTEALHLSVRDLIDVTYPDMGWVTKQFKIDKLSRNFEETDCITIEATAYNPDIYLKNGTPISEPEKLSFRPPHFLPLDIENLIVTTQKIENNIILYVSFQRPDDENFNHAEIYLSESEEELGRYLGNSTGGFIIRDIDNNLFYKISAISVSKLGRRALSTVSYMLHIDPAILYSPSIVENFVVSYSDGLISFEWEDIEDTDFDYYEIRQGSTWEGGTLVGSHIKQSHLTTKIIPSPDTYTYWIKAFDIYGDESVEAIDATLEIEDEKNTKVVFSKSEKLDGWLVQTGNIDLTVNNTNTIIYLKNETDVSTEDDFYKNLYIEVEGLGGGVIKNYVGSTRKIVLSEGYFFSAIPQENMDYKIYGIDSMFITEESTLMLASRKRFEDIRLFNR